MSSRCVVEPLASSLILTGPSVGSSSERALAWKRRTASCSSGCRTLDMPSMGAPSPVPCKPGTSILRPSSLMPCARSSIHSLRLSRSSWTPRKRSSAMRVSSVLSIFSDRLSNHPSGWPSTSSASAIGLPSSDRVMDPSPWSIFMIAPSSLISGMSPRSSSVCSICTSMSPTTSGSLAPDRRMFGFKPDIDGPLQGNGCATVSGAAILVISRRFPPAAGMRQPDS